MNSRAAHKGGLVCFCGDNAVIADLQNASCTVLKPHVSETSSKGAEIVCCTLSETGRRFAFTTEVKDVFVYERSDANWTPLRSFKLHRIGTSMKFTNKGEDVLLVADRAGDVHEYHLNAAATGSNGADDANKKASPQADDGDSDSDSETDDQGDGRFVLGHYSMLTDLVLAVDDSHVITADRDNKIRVSHYPNSYSIRAYCLAHQSYVIWISSVTLNGVNVLLSASGDGTLRGWDWHTGALLGTFHCGDAQSESANLINEDWPINYVSQVHDPRSSSRALLAVSFFNNGKLQFYTVQVEESADQSGQQTKQVLFEKLGEANLEGEVSSHVLVRDAAQVYCLVLSQTTRNQVVRLRVGLNEVVSIERENDELVQKISDVLSASVNPDSGEQPQRSSIFEILRRAPRTQSGTSSAGVQQYMERKQKRLAERAQKRKANDTDACS